MMYKIIALVGLFSLSLYSYTDIGYITDTFRGDDLELLQSFLQSSDQVNLSDKNNMTLLDYAAMYGNVRAIRMLTAAGACTHPREGDRTPMHYAVMFNKPDAVRALYEEGADINRRDNDGRTPLHIALLNKNFELTQLLLQLGADANAQAEFDETVLHYAVRTGERRFVELVLRYKPELSAESVFGHTALDVATKLGYDAIVEMLEVQGAPQGSGDDQFDWKHSYLMSVVDAGVLEVVQGMLAVQGFWGVLPEVDLEHEDHLKQTALMHALFYKYVDIAKALIEAGADVKHADKYGQTPLMLAVLTGDVELVKLILDKGANVAAFNENGTTALHMAAERGDVKMVELLLARGARTHLRDRYRRLPLHVAAKSGSLQVMRLLFDVGSQEDFEALSVHGTVRELIETSENDAFKDLVALAYQPVVTEERPVEVSARLTAAQIVTALLALTCAQKSIV